MERKKGVLHLSLSFSALLVYVGFVKRVCGRVFLQVLLKSFSCGMNVRRTREARLAEDREVAEGVHCAGGGGDHEAFHFVGMV